MIEEEKDGENRHDAVLCELTTGTRNLEERWRRGGEGSKYKRSFFGVIGRHRRSA